MSTAQQRAAAAMEQAAAREHEQLSRDEAHAAPPHSHAALPHAAAEQPDPAEHPHSSGQQVPSPQGTNATPPPMRAHVSAPPNSDPRHLHPIHVNTINNQGLEQRTERRMRELSARLGAVNQVQTEEALSLRGMVHDALAQLAFFTDATHRKEEAVRTELEHFKAYITSRVRELRAEQDRLGNFAAALTASSLTPPAALEAALTQHREQLLEAFRQELSALATQLCTEQVPDPVVEAEVAAEAAEAERLERENEEFRRALAERERVNAQPQPEQVQFVKHAPPPPPPPIAQPYATHIPPLFPQPTIPPPSQQPTPAALAPAPVPAAAWLPPPPPMPALDNPGLQAPKTSPPSRDPRLLPHPGAGRGGGRTGGGRGTGYFNQPPYKRARQERQPGSRSDMSASLAALSAQNRELKEQIASSQKN